MVLKCIHGAFSGGGGGYSVAYVHAGICPRVHLGVMNHMPSVFPVGSDIWNARDILIHYLVVGRTT